MKLVLNGSVDEIAEFLSKVLIAGDEEQDDQGQDNPPTIGFDTEY